jgi:norsolorinic acid ketoreductase
VSDTSALEAVRLLQTKHNITSVDLVIANAGIAEFYGTAVNTPLAGTREHLNVNAVSTLGLFQAVFPLLSATIDKGGPAPKFVAITSTVGSIGEMENIPMISTVYGASKAALNYIVKEIHMENPGIIAFPHNPGTSSNILSVFIPSQGSDDLSADYDNEIRWVKTDVSASTLQ